MAVLLMLRPDALNDSGRREKVIGLTPEIGRSACAGIRTPSAQSTRITGRATPPSTVLANAP